MLKVQLNHDFMNSLYFDGLRAGKNQFVANQENDYIASLSEEEFDTFMKDNNLVPYKQLLKQYEDGRIIGTFQA